MKLTGDQETAIKRFTRWFKNQTKPYFALAGSAGTGKTTITPHLTENCGRVLYAAYTGKAASVQREKGLNSSTLHKLIYKTDTLSGLNFTLNPDSEVRHANLVVVDEYSFLDKKMCTDLLSFGTPVLFFGDPGQLPPVHGKAFIESPDFFMEKVMRSDDEIINLSIIVREGRKLKPGKYGESKVWGVGEYGKDDVQESALKSDQIIVGTNDTRKSINRRMRELLGRESTMPVKGDKLICLRNNTETGIYNGQLFTALDTLYDGQNISMDMQDFGVADNPVYPEDDGVTSVYSVYSHPEYFQGKEPDDLSKADADCMDYGYAITGHKSQGSEFERVSLIDEWRFNHRRKWLYTAITRAKKSIDIFQR